MRLGSRAVYVWVGGFCLLVLAGVVWFRGFSSKQSTDLGFEPLVLSQIAANEAPSDVPKATLPAASPSEVNAVLFKFDPNTASETDFVKLGLMPKVARQIINYRNTGAKFRKPEDFKKIYALKEEDYKRLLPFIVLNANADPSEERNGAGSFGNSFGDKPRYRAKTNHPIEINGADEAVWMQQKGIGEGFARKIVAYRERLGGFLYKEQLKEVWGLPDSTYQNLLPFMSVDTTKMEKIDINSASLERLASHPYIGKYTAERIVQLRADMGKFNKIEDLRMVPLINEEKYRKIAQYFKAL